jgi:hypothetical protein
MTSAIYATSDYLIGNWESPDSNDGWTKCTWDPNIAPVLTPGVATGVTLGSGALKLVADLTKNGGWGWALLVSVDAAQFQAHDTFKLDITRLANEWTPPGSGSYWNGINFRVNSDTNGLVNLGEGESWWAPSDGNGPVTASWDYSSIKAGVGSSPLYLQFVFAVNAQHYVNTTGTFYLDNARLVKTPQPAALTIKKCKVTAGKTQGQNSNDINNIKDAFGASGTFSDFSPDLNDINQFDVSIYSVTEDGNVLIYNESNQFDVNDVAKGKFKYTHKIPRGGEGAITSLALDFTKLTFAIKAKNIDLTGLGCPLKLVISLGDYVPSGEANETIVNGKKSIPTRLMRMYDDTLIVKKSLGDSLSVSGDIAVADLNDANANDPNLVVDDVNIIWGDQTYNIPAGSFKAAKRGHSYKCSKIAADASKGLVGAALNLDKCTFTITVKNTDLNDVNDVSGIVPFGINFAPDSNEAPDFDETVYVNVALGH